MQICYKVNLKELAELTDEFAKKGREKQKVFLHQSSSLLRECIMFNTFKKVLLGDRNDEKFIRNFAPYIHQENRSFIFEQLETAIKIVEE